MYFFSIYIKNNFVLFPFIIHINALVWFTIMLTYSFIYLLTTYILIAQVTCICQSMSYLGAMLRIINKLLVNLQNNVWNPQVFPNCSILFFFVFQKFLVVTCNYVARQCGVSKMVSIEEARRRLVGDLLEKMMLMVHFLYIVIILLRIDIEVDPWFICLG